MIRLLPPTPRGTWLLAGAVWLAGCGALWWVLPYRPRAAWPTEEPAVVHGFIPGTAVVLTSSGGDEKIFAPVGPTVGPLLARNAANGLADEWLPKGERITLVDPGTDGRHIAIGRRVGDRARLFLHDATNGALIAELPRGGDKAEKEDRPRDDYEQFTAFRPDGQQIAYVDRVGDEGWLRIWDMAARKEVASLPDAYLPVAWAPDGRTVAYTFRGNEDLCDGRLWDPATGKTCSLALPPDGKRRWAQLALSRDGRTVLAQLWPSDDAERDKVPPYLIAWQVLDSTETSAQRRRANSSSERGPWFATTTMYGLKQETTLRRWDHFDSGHDESYLLWPPRLQTSHSFSPDGRLLFGYEGRENRILELVYQHVLRRPPGGTTTVGPELWDTASGEPRYSLPMSLRERLSGPASRHCWSPDGRLLAVDGREGVAVWDIPPRKSLSWFVGGAALLAWPLVFVARRQARRLGQEVAA